ncbi:MAG: hypothetical protein IPM15_11440 [Betaproteobacteria bacterium]|nr:hypothetical protein [Betaproteobacteria bacterium]MCC6246803.1 hypothetical protein [Rubrivivax sp.]MCL4696489.1 hypothetical protein [Burkholderiaceae bacterium]
MLRVLIIVAVLVALALWMLKGRRSGSPDAGSGAARRRGNEPATMVACAHCGVHLPRPDASYDAEGRSYCGETHRVAGPR